MTPEEDRTNLARIKLVMLNVIITLVKQNDHPTRGAATTWHDYSLWAFYFLTHNSGGWAAPNLIALTTGSLEIFQQSLCSQALWVHM